MAKSEEAMKRLFENVFICMKCNGKIRANPAKVRDKKIKCRKCSSYELRLKKKRRKK